MQISHSPLRTFLLFISVASLLSGCSNKPALDPAGFYLSEGGRSYVEINRGADGNLTAVPRHEGPTTTINVEADRFVLTETMSMGNGEIVSTKHFKPSASAPGDWDLVEHVISTSIGGNSDQSTLKQPISSYLHRADRSAREYYSLLESIGPRTTPEEFESIRKQLLEQAQAIVAKSPDDIHLRVLMLDALQRNRDAAGLAAELARDETPLRASGNVCLVLAADMASRNAKVLQAESAGKNAWERVAAPCDLATQYNLLLKLPDDFTFRSPDILYLGGPSVPNFLALQTFTRVMRTEAVFAMLSGQPQDALKILSALIRMGQEMVQDGTLINRLLGFAIRSISIAGMDFYVLNVSDSPQDLDRVWLVLERLRADYTPPDEAAMCSAESSAKNYEGRYKQNMLEALTRSQACDAQFELLRMATAARAAMLSAGSFPAQADRFAPYFPKGLPADPFTSASLLMISTADKFTAYSTGPDRDDDHAGFSYDPTNGTLSDGDIVLEVPRRRQYPIPAGGLRGVTPQDIRRQLPGGLPADVFASTRGNPLNIGQTRPLTIFSWGPDMDERVGQQEVMPPNRFKARTVPEIQYDPTNGTNSDGDLIMTLGQ